MSYLESFYYSILYGYVSIGIGHYTYKVIKCIKEINEIKHIF